MQEIELCKFIDYRLKNLPSTSENSEFDKFFKGNYLIYLKY